MTSTSRLLLSLFVSLFFVGCAQDVANRYYSAVKYPPKTPAEVELLSRAPARPHTVIADFQSRNETPNSMRKRAAKIGADGIIVSPVGGSYALDEEWAGNDRMSRSYSRLIGSAIKYTK